jgi:hypothetical protein
MMTMNRQQRRAAAAYKRKWKSGEYGVGTMLYTQTIGVQHPHGYFFYWFETAENWKPEHGIPADAVMHGPFKTDAECNENQRIVMFGPQCEMRNGGNWDPAWNKPQ